MSRERASKCAVLVLALLTLSDGCRVGQLAYTSDAARDRPTIAATRTIPSTALWWNRPAFVARFALSTQQRARMDEARAQYVAAQQEASAKEQAAREAVAQALWEGEWVEARQKLTAVSTVADERERLRTEMEIRILGELTEVQRRRLATELPRLLRAPWASIAPTVNKGHHPPSSPAAPEPAREDDGAPDAPSNP
jgi:hypothetical protein